MPAHNGLIGRDQELALCLEQLRQPRALVVLFGPPGVGKTALAEQLTAALLLEPLDLIARVCALVPPPRLHMVRYYGVLSSHAKVRSEVVPKPDVESLATRVV